MPRMKGVLIVKSEPSEGQEDAYNEWYDNVHLPEVLAIAGFVSARRFVAEPSIGGELPEQRYVAIYEMEGDDLAAVQAGLKAAAGSFTMSGELNRRTASTLTYRLISEATG